MRILIASSSTIPGYSGGWTTPLDLLGTRHVAMYVICGTSPGYRRFEGIPVLGLGLLTRQLRNTLLERIRCRIEREIVPVALKRCFNLFKADFIMCLDENAGFAAERTGLPYTMRFHQRVGSGTDPVRLERLIRGAVFATSSQSTDVPGTMVLPHYEDMSRFAFSASVRPERALLLSVLNAERAPQDFIEGVMGSRSMNGDIIGTGPLISEVGRLCKATGGRVRLLPPLPRLRTGEISGRYQVGVATLAPRPKPLYQMKVNAYMSCGMHVVVNPWTEAAHEIPNLVEIYENPEGLSAILDSIQENWLGLEDRRQSALRWVKENYSIETPRRLFNDLLAKHFPGSATSS